MAEPAPSRGGALIERLLRAYLAATRPSRT